VSVQGLNHLVNSHIQKIAKKKEAPASKPSIAKEGETFLLVDGNNGPGPIAAFFAVDLAIKKAKKTGSCIAGIKNSHDIYQVGLYVERIAREGLVGFVYSDDVVPVVAPLGGCKPVIGSNPMAIAIPTEAEPFLLDFAPCATLPTYVRYSKRYEASLPEGVVVDGDGNPTTDPNAVCDGAGYQGDKGAINPLGNKGYGLLLVIDFLSGAFVGCDMGMDHVNKPGSRKGHFFMVIDPTIFGSLEDFKQAVGGRIQQLKASKTAPGTSEIRIPGERSFQNRKRSLREGQVFIDEKLWEDTVTLCNELGVKVPE
jgi:L-2-hydroxycarboxylate dehydrogenase (NAD+)